MFRGDVLRQARAAAKLTQEEAAERIRAAGGACASRTTYSRWEFGAREPQGAATLAAIERVLRVRVSSLVEEREAA